jgi:hypothetical protein
VDARLGARQPEADGDDDQVEEVIGFLAGIRPASTP